ncbi:MAG: IS66 family insertion sequence element accessory protein TnpB [Fulvivirga sp.]
MFNLSSAHRFFLYDQPTDMRKGFDSLAGLVRSQMHQDPTNGSVFLFMNKNRNLVKLLHWEYGGFTLYYKRLEKGVFERPITDNNQLITWSQLVLIIEGIKLDYVVKKTRHNLTQKYFMGCF